MPAPLRTRGYRVGIAGNQPKGAVAVLVARPVRGLRRRVVFARVEKPSAAFFAQVAALSCVAVREIAYVGDRLDNDILPARAAGMATIFLLRGPWAPARLPEAAFASVQLTSLTEIPDALTRMNAS